MHTGGDYGTKAIAIALPNTKKGLVLFSNPENGMENYGRKSYLNTIKKPDTKLYVEIWNRIAKNA